MHRIRWLVSLECIIHVVSYARALHDHILISGSSMKYMPSFYNPRAWRHSEFVGDHRTRQLLQTLPRHLHVLGSLAYPDLEWRYARCYRQVSKIRVSPLQRNRQSSEVRMPNCRRAFLSCTQHMSSRRKGIYRTFFRLLVIESQYSCSLTQSRIQKRSFLDQTTTVLYPLQPLHNSCFVVMKRTIAFTRLRTPHKLIIKVQYVLFHSSVRSRWDTKSL